MSSLVLAGDFRELTSDELYEVNGGLVFTTIGLVTVGFIAAKQAAKVATVAKVAKPVADRMIQDALTTGQMRGAIGGAIVDAGIVATGVAWATSLFR